MKKLLIAIAIGAFALVGTAINTEARPCGGDGYRTPANTIYVSGYRYGRPVYTEKIFVGYDCHGHPRFTYRQVNTFVFRKGVSRYHSGCASPRASGLRRAPVGSW